jgi:hypothetical protein
MTSFDRSRGCPMCENDPAVASCSHCGDEPAVPPVPAEPRLTVKQAAEKAGVEIASKPHRNWKSAGEVDVREFVNPAEPPTDKSEYSSEYPDPKNASSMSTVDLIEWIAQIAYDGRDWGWIKDELMRRFAVPAEPRSAEQFYKEWAESSLESLWATKRPAKVAIAFAEAYAATLREQLAALHEFSDKAVDLAAERKVGIDSLGTALLSAQKEIQELRAKYEKKS